MIEVESKWLINNFILRESKHTPYLYILKQQKFKEELIIDNQKLNNYLIDLIKSGKI